MRKSIYVLFGIVVAGGIVLQLALYILRDNSWDGVDYFVPSHQASEIVSEEVLLPTQTVTPAPIVFVGPRDNIPDGAPTAYGFWSFAVPVSGRLSRSGQPTISEFEWLASQGWKSVINLRVDGERGETGDDAKLAGFNDLGLTYVHLPITDGHPPTDEQAEEFLILVTNSAHWPVHIHCRGGIGRTGTMVALYRYAVQRWPMERAIEESRPFEGGISSLQQTWLEKWAVEHQPGSHALKG